MAVEFDSVGSTQGTANFNPNLIGSWTHTTVAAHCAALVAFNVTNRGFAASGQTPSATWDGAAMTLLGIVGNANAMSNENYTAVYGVLDTGAAGAHTAAGGSSGGGNTGRSIATTSLAYTGVGSFGTVLTGGGSGTAPSIAGSGSNDLLVNIFGDEGGSTISGYNATARSNLGTSDNGAAIATGDHAGPSFTFAETLAASAGWSALVVPLIGASNPAQFFPFFIGQ